MSFRMMSKLIVRRELSRCKCRCVLPFCYRFDASVKGFVESNNSSIQREMSTKSNQNLDNKNKNNSNLEENPFYEKYSVKIKTALKDKSYDSKAKPLMEDKEPVLSTDNMNKQNDNELPVKSDITNNFKQRIESSKSKNTLNQSLDDIVKLELLKDRSAQEITEIWKNYHMSRDCIFAVIPSETYDRMFWLSSKYKTFVLPVPRANRSQTNHSNYEFILSQFVGHKCFFTPLVAYQTHKDLAPVCLTIHYFPELQKDKQIVLMLGEYDTNLLNGFEAQCLANQLQWYYSSDQNVRQNILLHQFNCEPNLFDHMQVIRELEDNILSAGIAAKSNPK